MADLPPPATFVVDPSEVTSDMPPSLDLVAARIESIRGYFKGLIGSIQIDGAYLFESVDLLVRDMDRALVRHPFIHDVQVWVDGPLIKVAIMPTDWVYPTRKTLIYEIKHHGEEVA